jgi:hypothetical protein
MGNMLRKMMGILLSAALLLAVPLPAKADHMDCYPAMVYRDPNGKFTRCIIDHEQSCLWCNVVIIID